MTAESTAAHVSDAERDLVATIFQAYRGLIDRFGWREAEYSPKNLSPLLLIEAGSTGIHRGHRDAIGFWISDEVDTWPSIPILFKPAPEATP